MGNCLNFKQFCWENTTVTQNAWYSSKQLKHSTANCWHLGGKKEQEKVSRIVFWYLVDKEIWEVTIKVHWIWSCIIKYKMHLKSTVYTPVKHLRWSSSLFCGPEIIQFPINLKYLVFFVIPSTVYYQALISMSKSAW